MLDQLVRAGGAAEIDGADLRMDGTIRLQALERLADAIIIGQHPADLLLHVVETRRQNRHLGERAELLRAFALRMLNQRP